MYFEKVRYASWEEIIYFTTLTYMYTYSNRFSYACSFKAAIVKV